MQIAAERVTLYLVPHQRYMLWISSSHSIYAIVPQVTMAGGGKSVRSPFSVARKEPSASREESSSEEAVHSEPAEAPREGSKARGRKRSHAEHGRSARARRHNRDPSHSHVQRNLRRKQRREGDRKHRRHRRTHRSRRARSATPDKRRRSASSGRGANAARPPEPSSGPSKTGTQKCPHCWAEVTVQPSGRAQHQWSNRTCLQWQFYNEMDAEAKKKNDTEAWNKAKEAAAVLYERRRWVAAPHAIEDEMPRAPLPPVMLRSRSSIRAAAPAEMEEVAVEEEAEGPQRPSRSCPGGQAMGASGSTGSKGQGHGPPPAEPPAVKTERPGSSQKQQIVINITSS